MLNLPDMEGLQRMNYHEIRETPGYFLLQTDGTLAASKVLSGKLKVAITEQLREPGSARRMKRPARILVAWKWTLDGVLSPAAICNCCVAISEGRVSE